MRTYSGKELIRLLQKHGWDVVRIEGSHHIMTHADREETLSIPVHGNNDLKIGLVRSILGAARIRVD